jgi:hypothetical protein
VRVYLCLFAILVCLVAAAANAYAATIAEVKQVNSSGIPVKIGQTVTVSGVVTVANGTFNTRDLDVHIQDRTAGLYLSLRDAAWIPLSLGDSVVVTGIVDQEGRTPRRNDTKLSLLSAAGISIVGRTEPVEPLTVTAADLAATAQPPLEVYEGLLVRVVGLEINAADWPAAGTEKFITASDGTANLAIRLDRDTDIPGSPPPDNPFIAVGVIIQDSSNPFTGYHLWPRSRYGDILVMGNGSGVAAIEPREVETDEESFDLYVRLEGNGTDVITSFEIDLPLADGWGWDAVTDNVALSGPGLADASFEVEAGKVVVHSAGIGGHASFGVVTLLGVAPPNVVRTSEIAIRTSVDGETFEPIALYPTIEALLPLPDVVVNEVFPNNGFYLEDFTLYDLRKAPYCDPAPRITFGALDTIAAGGYLVIAESSTGFHDYWGFDPDTVAPISPLGRAGGDGATVKGTEAYEAVTLRRGGVTGLLIDYCEYKSPLIAETDVCTGLGGLNDAFPIIPPIGYSLARDEGGPEAGASYLDFVMSSTPTPGAENVPADTAPPTISNVVGHSQDVIEVQFNEPCDSLSLADPSAYDINGEEPIAVYVSLTLQKVALLFEGFEAGVPATVTVDQMPDIAGNVGENLTFDFTTSTRYATSICEVQEYDEKGYSPLLGQTVTVIGFITVPKGVFQAQYNSIYIQGLDGCGVNVFSYDPPSPNPGLGDLVRATGEVQEYVSGTAGATTELFVASPTSEVLLSPLYPEPEAAVFQTGKIGSEENEGKLIATEGAIVSANDFGFYVNDGSGGVQVYQNYTDIDYTQFRVGMYVKVQGVILQYDRTLPFFEGYELVPRWDSDIVIVEDAYPGGAVLNVEPRVFCPSCGEGGFAIRFDAPSAAQVTLRIFDGKGRLVLTLFSGLSVGEGEKVWDGRAADGQPVPPGLYVCFLDSTEPDTGRRTTDSAPIVVGVELK